LEDALELLARHYIRKGEKVEKKIEGFAATNEEIRNANRELRIFKCSPCMVPVLSSAS
jgi:hypothetical protein